MVLTPQRLTQLNHLFRQALHQLQHLYSHLSSSSSCCRYLSLTLSAKPVIMYRCTQCTALYSCTHRQGWLDKVGVGSYNSSRYVFITENTDSIKFFKQLQNVVRNEKSEKHHVKLAKIVRKSSLSRIVEEGSFQ